MFNPHGDVYVHRTISFEFPNYRYPLQHRSFTTRSSITVVWDLDTVQEPFRRFHFHHRDRRLYTIRVHKVIPTLHGYTTDAMKPDNSLRGKTIDRSRMQTNRQLPKINEITINE